MSTRRQYLKRSSQIVVAIQLSLRTDGFTYEKWGSTQLCKQGDWLVDNYGDVYTVDRDTFQRTYATSGLGTYTKITPVWAEVAEVAGEVVTKEGTTHYERGDYLVFNQHDGGDTYAVAKNAFESMYEACS